jgi:hypothetical protein
MLTILISYTKQETLNGLIFHEIEQNCINSIMDYATTGLAQDSFSPVRTAKFKELLL